MIIFTDSGCGSTQNWYHLHDCDFNQNWYHLHDWRCSEITLTVAPCKIDIISVTLTPPKIDIISTILWLHPKLSSSPWLWLWLHLKLTSFLWLWLHPKLTSFPWLWLWLYSVLILSTWLCDFTQNFFFSWLTVTSPKINIYLTATPPKIDIISMTVTQPKIYIISMNLDPISMPTVDCFISVSHLLGCIYFIRSPTMEERETAPVSTSRSESSPLTTRSGRWMKTMAILPHKRRWGSFYLSWRRTWLFGWWRKRERERQCKSGILTACMISNWGHLARFVSSALHYITFIWIFFLCSLLYLFTLWKVFRLNSRCSFVTLY